MDGAPNPHRPFVILEFARFIRHRSGVSVIGGFRNT